MQPATISDRPDAERKIGSVWREVLNVPFISLDDNVFNLGGTSIHIVQAYSKLRDALSVEITVVDLFSHPTIRSLLDHLYPAQGSSPSFQGASDRAAKQRQALEFNRQVNDARRGDQR